MDKLHQFYSDLWKYFVEDLLHELHLLLESVTELLEFCKFAEHFHSSESYIRT